MIFSDDRLHCDTGESIDLSLMGVTKMEKVREKAELRDDLIFLKSLFIRFFVLIIGFYLFSFMTAQIGHAAEARTLSFGIVPQQAAAKLARLWVPIFKHIEKETGVKLKFATAKNIPTFEKRCAEGKYDFAYMNPYHYTVFHKSPGYISFAKQKNKRIKGIVVVRKDSPVRKLAELADKTLAFPSPAAFAASVLPKANFRKKGIAITPKYVSSHDSVYRSVAKGLYPAGGGIQRTFNNVAPNIKSQLRVLWTTRGYTPHAFAAHPRVDKKIIVKVQEAMIAMNASPKGKVLLKTIKFKGIESAQNADWDDVRGLGIKVLSR